MMMDKPFSFRGAVRKPKTPTVCYIRRQAKAARVPAVLIRPKILEEIRQVQMDLMGEVLD